MKRAPLLTLWAAVVAERLGQTIRLLPTEDGELRAADGDLPADPVGVQRYLAKAFGQHLQDVRAAMEELASRYDLTELRAVSSGQKGNAEDGRVNNQHARSAPSLG